MKIAIIGKYPPIQGGVSARTYRTAHALALRGHELHVVTNAREADPPFRMLMRPADWARCEARYGRGSVTVHWTDPVDRSQSYLPMASPFVSKLASVAAAAHERHRFDVILAHYLEPYGVAGHLVAEMTGVPLVVRMAGSDAGRLWHHPQFEPLYDHVLRSAAVVIAGGKVARRAVARGVDPRRIAYAGGFAVPEDMFKPAGKRLDLARIRTESAKDTTVGDALWGQFRGGVPSIGVFGKLGETKGSFALLDALRRLADQDLDIGLVALAHGKADVEAAFRARALQLGLADRILQIPFVPHWRVPEFLRGCLAVCCLEQDFPIGIHSPITPREVMLCGTGLVASTEVLHKLPGIERLPHGYGCVAIRDVNDIDELSGALAAIVRAPDLAKTVGARARAFAQALQRDQEFPDRLERVLETAARRRPLARGDLAISDAPALQAGAFPFAGLAAAALAAGRPRRMRGKAQHASLSLAEAKRVLAALSGKHAQASPELRALAPAIAAEIAAAGSSAQAARRLRPDPLFRLKLATWAMAGVADLFPRRLRRLHVIAAEGDASRRPEGRRRPRARDLSASIAVFAPRAGAARPPLLIDAASARALALSDGSRTAHAVAEQLAAERVATARDALRLIEELFLLDLLSLHDAPRPVAGNTPVPAHAAARPVKSL